MSRSGAIASLVALVAGVLTATAMASLPAIGGITVPTTGITLPVTLPGVSIPTVTVPTVSVPTVSVPVVTVPAVTTPVVTTPAVTTPTVSVPTVTLPGGTDGTGTVTDQVSDAVDAVVNSNPTGPGSSVSDAKVGALITKFFGASSNPGAAGTQDKRAPKLKFKVVSKLRNTAKTGKLKLRVTSDEAAIVAFNGLLRAGRARVVHGKTVHVSRKLFKTKSKALTFRKKGTLSVSIKVPKAARATLRNVKTLRLALQTWATDISRNQTRKNIKRTIRR